MEPVIIVPIFDCHSLIERGVVESSGCLQLLIHLFSKFYELHKKKFSEFTASSEQQRSKVMRYKRVVAVLLFKTT